MPKFHPRIVGRRPLNVVVPVSGQEYVANPQGRSQEMEAVDVEWTHDDGPIAHTHLVPVMTYEDEFWYDAAGNEHVKLTPVHKTEQRKAETVKVIKDQLIVPVGTSDNWCLLKLEEQRERLAANLRIEP